MLPWRRHDTSLSCALYFFLGVNISASCSELCLDNFLKPCRRWIVWFGFDIFPLSPVCSFRGFPFSSFVSRLFLSVGWFPASLTNSVSTTNAHAHAAACVYMLRWGGALLTTRWACIPLITSSLAFTWGLYHVLDSLSLTPLFSLFISCFIYFSPAFHASKTTNTYYNIEPRSAHNAFISYTLQQKSTRKTPIRMQAHMSSYSIVW